MMVTRQAVLLGCALALSAPSTQVALAQTVAGADEEASGIFEVVVTAQKRAEPVQEVPKSIEVVGPDLLARAGATQLNDLAAVVPSLQPPVGTNVRSLTMRGISTLGWSQQIQSQVGIVLDDVPVPSWSTVANELSDVERIEVLAGPQSTLSGRNAAAGLINIVTRSPTAEWQANVSAEITDDSQQRVTAYLSGPLAGEALTFSLSGFSNQWDGNVRNTLQSDRLFGGFDNEGIRGKLRWRMSDDLTTTLTAYSQSQFSYPIPFGISGVFVSAAPGAVGFWTPPGLTTAEQHQQDIGPSNHSFASALTGWTKKDDTGVSLRIDREFASATVSFIGSYARSRQPRLDDIQGFPYENTFIAEVPLYDGYAHAFSGTSSRIGELRATSHGSGPLQYVAGVIYSDDSTRFDYYRVLFPFFAHRESTFRSVAAYSHLTWEMTATNSLTGGLRAQRDRFGYEFRFLQGPGVAQNPALSKDEDSYSFVSGEASFQHRFSDDAMAYVTFARGETGQVYDLENNAGAQGESASGGPVGILEPLESQTVNSAELGIKTQWLDRRLTLNASLYYADYDHFQAQAGQVSGSGAPTFVLLDIGQVTTRGFELQAGLRATSALSFDGGVAYTDAVVEDFREARCYNGQTPELGCNVSLGDTPNSAQRLVDARMPNAPKFKAFFGPRYRFELAGAPFDVQLGAFYRYQSKVGFDIYQDPGLVQDGYGILNLSLDVIAHDDRWQVQLFANNVFDKHYQIDLRSLNGLYNGQVAYAQNLPRDFFRYFGGRLSYKF